MQVKSNTECSKGEHSAILSTFIKIPFVIKIFVLSIFEWPFYTSFVVFYDHQLRAVTTVIHAWGFLIPWGDRNVQAQVTKKYVVAVGMASQTLILRVRGTWNRHSVLLASRNVTVTSPHTGQIIL